MDRRMCLADSGYSFLEYASGHALRRAYCTDVDREQARTALLISSYGGFLVAQAAAKRMLPRKSGTILFTGASASVKGHPHLAVFAMGKFALRGLAQSMA